MEDGGRRRRSRSLEQAMERAQSRFEFLLQASNRLVIEIAKLLGHSQQGLTLRGGRTGDPQVSLELGPCVERVTLDNVCLDRYGRSADLVEQRSGLRTILAVGCNQCGDEKPMG